jgi:hypothetical protein
MEKTTKTILIVSSVIALGGIAYLIIKGRTKKSSLQNEVKDFTPLPLEQTTTTTTKPNVLASLGIEVPRLKPLNFQSLTEMLKGKNWLKIGEQVPNKTTTTLTTPPSSNYGVDQKKLADYKAKYGTK